MRWLPYAAASVNTEGESFKKIETTSACGGYKSAGSPPEGKSIRQTITTSFAKAFMQAFFVSLLLAAALGAPVSRQGCNIPAVWCPPEQVTANCECLSPGASPPARSGGAGDQSSSGDWLCSHLGVNCGGGRFQRKQLRRQSGRRRRRVCKRKRTEKRMELFAVPLLERPRSVRCAEWC